MKNLQANVNLSAFLIAFTLLGAGSSCNDSVRFQAPHVPDPRPPHLTELYDEALSLAMGPAPGTPAPFNTWQGLAALELGGPDAGLDHLPLVLELLAGFESLGEGCLSGEPDVAEWSYQQATGEVLARFVDEHGSGLVFTGTLEKRFEATPAGPDGSRPAGTPLIVASLHGAGTWTVNPAGCEGDDFSFGTTGTWELGDGVAAMTADPDGLGEPAGDPVRRTTLLVVDEHGEVALHAVEEVYAR